MENIW